MNSVIVAWHGLYLGGAVLGARTTVTVNIARTGYANGMFGFRGSLSLRVARSTSVTTVALMLERTGGLQGNQIVSVEQLLNGLVMLAARLIELIFLALSKYLLPCRIDTVNWK